MPRCLRAEKSVKKVQESCCKQNHSNTCKNEQKHLRKSTILNLTGEAFIARYDELTELSAQLAANLRISNSLQSRRRNPQCNGIVADKTEEQTASNFSDVARANTTHDMQFASTSQVSSSHRLEAKSAKRSSKNSVKENRKDDKTIVSANSKYRTKNLVTNQIRQHVRQILF